MGKTSKQRAICTVIAGFLVTTGGGIAATLALFYLPVTQDLGFSQAKFAAYVSILSLCGVISNPVMGKVFGTHIRHIRGITLAGGILALVCCLLLSASSHLWQFYAVGAVMSILLPYASSMLGVTVVSRWLTTGKSVGISLVAIGASVGTVIHSQVVTRCIENLSWRAGYVSEGILLVVCFAIAALLMSPPPEFFGMKPWGKEEAETKESLEEKSGFRTLAGMPSFWFIALAAGVGCVYIMFIQQSIVPMLQVDFGMQAAGAATVLSAYSIVCACCKPVMGLIFKRFHSTISTLYVGILVAAASLVVFFAPSKSVAIGGIILIAIGNMFGTVLLPSLVTDFFGAKIYPVVMGYVNIFFTVGASIAPVVIGRTYDITESYHLIYLFICFACVVTTLLLLMAGKTRKTVKSE